MKRVLVRMTPEIIGTFCRTTTGSFKIIIDGVPKDSKFVAAFYKHEEGCFHVCFEDDSFEAIPEGNPLPFVDIKITTHFEK